MLLRSLLALVLVLGLPLVAAAQPGPFGPFGPGGVIQQSSPSSAVTAPTITISPPTGSSQTVLSTTLNASVFTSKLPLHFIAHGRLSTLGGSPGTLTMSMTLGTGSALTFMNAVTLTSALSNIPITFDCMGGPQNISTGSAAQYSLTCSATWVESGTTPKISTATAIVAVASTSRFPSTVTALWALTFSNSGNGNALLVDDWVWKVN